jgi:hypothetical protein
LKLFLLVVCVVLTPLLFAQRTTDTLEIIYPLPYYNTLTSNFDKQLNTYSLQNSLNYYLSSRYITFNLSENYSSTLISTAQKSIRDEHNFRFKLNYNLFDRTKIGTSLRNTIFSDNRRIEINQASVSNALLFLEFLPTQKITILPFGGYSNNRQIGENDYGFIYGIEGLANNVSLGEMNLLTELKFRNEDILPRRNTSRFLNVIASNYFTDDVANALTIRLTEFRRDFYFLPDSATAAFFNISSNIQSRTEKNYLLQDHFIYNNFLQLFSLEAAARIYWRDISRNISYKNISNPSSVIFDTRLEELRLELDATNSYRSELFDGILRFIYSEKDEKNNVVNEEGVPSTFYEQRAEIERSKNNFSIRAALSVAGQLKLSRSDRIIFSLLQNKFKYDTPAESNFDDRDELLSIVRIQYLKQLTPFFQSYINLEGNINHTVYLFAEKSSNNNKNRVIRLASGGNYRGKKFTTVNNFEVSANYTVYDFEDVILSNRSFSFRQFNASDSTTLWFSNTTGLGFYGYLKLSEQGELRWASFSTKPFRFLEEIYAEPKFLFSFSNLQLSVGIRYYSLKTFNYNDNQRRILSNFSSTGPLTELILSLNQKLNLRIYGWYEYVSQEQINYNQTNLIMSMNWVL